MSTPNRFDIRQSETRILQDQLSGSAIAGMDAILASVNSEVTPVLRLFANNTLIVNVQNSVVSNPSTLRNRSIAPINGSVPSFASGSVTVPSSNGGNITTSTGGSTVLNCPSGNFVKIIVSMDSSGGLSTVCGTPQSTANAALVPAPPALQLPIGYLLVQNIGGVIQNISNSSVYQFTGASASASSSGGSIPAITYYDYTTTTLPVSGVYSPDGTPVVNGDSVLFSNLSSGNNEAYVVSGVGGTLTWTPLSIFGGSPIPSEGDLIILMEGNVFGKQILYFDGTTWETRQLDRLFSGNTVYVDRTVFQQSLLASQTNANLTGLSGASNAVVSGYSVDYRLKSTGTNVAEFPTFYTNTSGGTTNPSIAPLEFVNIITQADGKYVVAGLTSAATPSVASIIRYNATGTIDSSFQSTMGTGFAGSVTGGTGGAVAVAQQPSDSSLVIGGSFTTFKGNSRLNLVRVALNGTEDTAFYTNLGTGFSEGGSASQVQAVAIQPTDGKILAGGAFSSFNGNSRTVIVRLNSDGTEDTTFATNVAAIPLNGNTQSISVQTDGKIVLAGNVGVPGFPTIGLVRLNANGTLDTTFETNIGSGFGGGQTAQAVVQTNGQIVVVGRFTTFNGNSRGFITRLNSDGTEDSTFVTNSGTGFAGTSLNGVSLQPNGQIAVVGSTTSYNGSGVASGIVNRLNSDGTLDTVFGSAINSSSSNNSANAIVTPTNGLMVIAGFFTTFVGVTRHGIAEILTDTITRVGTLQVAIAQDTIKTTDVGTDSGPIASGITFNANLSGSTINVTYSTSSNAFTGVFDVETFY